MAVRPSIPVTLTLLAAACMALLPALASAQSKTGKAAAKSSTKKPAAQTRASKTATSRVQTHPTPERYAEIEQALHDRGYLASEPDGKWDQESVNALKRFQHDQSLLDDGKLGALSLTALGLGPKRAPVTMAQTGPGSVVQPQDE